MAFLNDRVLDNGLTVLDTEGDRLDWCSQEPTTYEEATSTYSRGYKTSLSIGAPGDRVGGGRKVTVAAVSDGTGTSTGNVTHWAISDVSETRLLATGALSGTVAVASGGVITSTEFDIGIPDPS